MAYRYHTEPVFLEEKLFGRTGAHDTEAITALSDRFNSSPTTVGSCSASPVSTSWGKFSGPANAGV